MATNLSRNAIMASARSDIYMAIRDARKEYNLTDAETTFILAKEITNIAYYANVAEREEEASEPPPLQLPDTQKLPITVFAVVLGYAGLRKYVARVSDPEIATIETTGDGWFLIPTGKKHGLVSVRAVERMTGVSISEEVKVNVFHE